MSNYKLTSNGQSLKAAGFTYNSINAAIYAAENNLQPGDTFTGAHMTAWSKKNCKSPWRECRSTFEITARSGWNFDMRVNGDEIFTFSAAPRGEAASATPADEAEAAGTATGEPTVGSVDATAAAIAEALRGLRPAAESLDEARVREIVKAEVAKIGGNYKGVEVKTVSGTKKIDNSHPLLEDVLGLVVNDIPVYLVGPAGTGKSTLCFQVAEALGLEFYSCSSLQQKYELEGYTDPVGKLIETEFFKFCKEGGIFLIDEIDNTAAEVLIAFNTALANGYYTFPGTGRVKIHKDCHFIAAGNTNGRGADNTYNGRFQLDGSTLDRYAFVNVDYCEEIELAVCEGDKELVKFAHDLRKVISDYNLTYTVSPRFLERFAKMQKLGWTDEKCLQTALTNGWDKANIKTISAKLSKNNKYSKVFANISK